MGSFYHFFVHDKTGPVGIFLRKLSTRAGSSAASFGGNCTTVPPFDVGGTGTGAGAGAGTGAETGRYLILVTYFVVVFEFE